MKTIVEKAIEEGKLMEYLGGFPGYRLHNPAANTPTESGAVLESLLDYIKADAHGLEKFCNALADLSEDAEYGWMVAYYLVDIKQLEKVQGIKVLDDGSTNRIRQAFRQNKAHWINNNAWHGRNHRGGLWGAIQAMNNLLARDYGFTILPEEL